jgi:predicted Zn finger-like uncharacterized protein
LRRLCNDAIAGVIMRLVCPNCRAEYEVPDAALKDRKRTLRCGNCGASWSFPEADPQAAVSLPPVPGPEATAENLPSVPAAEEASSPEPEPVPSALPVERTPVPPAETEQLGGSQARRTPPKLAQGRPSGSRGLKISVLLVALLVVGVLVAHRPISVFWPPSLWLFHALGLH